MTMKKIIISLEIETDNDIEQIRTALKRGIYRGLDTPPIYIAAPDKVKINSIELEDDEVECDGCGAMIDESHNYCPNCGDENF